MTENGYEVTPYTVKGGNIYFAEKIQTVVSADAYITEADIPEEINGVRVSCIGPGALSFCDKLKKVTIPGTVRLIDNSAFHCSSELETVIIKDGVEEIKDWAFDGCLSLTHVIIPKTVFCLGLGVFSNTLLKTAGPIGGGCSLEFGWDEVMAHNPFSGCENLIHITIPENITDLYASDFIDCKMLQDIKVSDRNEFYADIDGVVFSKDLSEIVAYPRGRAGVYSIPDGVKTVGDFAFYHCEELTEINMPEGTERIGKYAFSDCPLIRKLAIPESVVSIGDYAFSGCSFLRNVSIPKNVRDIGKGIFISCNFMDDIRIDEDNDKYTVIDGVLFEKDLRALVRCPVGKTGEYVIPDGVAVIGPGAFCGCKSLEKIIIPDSVKIIEDSAFEGCTALEKLTVPDSVMSIGSRAFAFCHLLPEVNIPYGVATISTEAFMECRSLESVHIPDSVTTIKRAAFLYCVSLTEIVIAHKVSKIEMAAFHMCMGLEDVYYEGTEEEWKAIGGEDGLFENVSTIHFRTGKKSRRHDRT